MPSGRLGTNLLPGSGARDVLKVHFAGTPRHPEPRISKAIRSMLARLPLLPSTLFFKYS